MARKRKPAAADYPLDELREVHELVRRIERQMDRFEAILKAWGYAPELTLH